MTDEQFIDAARAMATEFLDTIARTGLSQNDTANLAGAAMGEVLGQTIGPFAAVERMRDIADRMEAQMIS